MATIGAIVIGFIAAAIIYALVKDEMLYFANEYDRLFRWVISAVISIVVGMAAMKLLDDHKVSDKDLHIN